MPNQTKAFLFRQRAEQLRRMAKDVDVPDWRERIDDLASQYEQIAIGFEAPEIAQASKRNA